MPEGEPFDAIDWRLLLSSEELHNPLADESDKSFPQQEDSSDFLLILAQENLDGFADCCTPNAITMDGSPANELLDNLLGRKSSSLSPNPPDISEGLGKQEVKRNLVDLAEFTASSDCFMVYENTLFQYDGRCWNRLSKHTCTVCLREFLSEYGLTEALNSRDYAEIYSLLMTAPTLQRKEKFPHHSGLLNLKDGILNLHTMTLMPHHPKDGFFSYLDVAHEDMANANGDAFEQFIHIASNGDSDVRQQILEVIAIAITGLEVKSFFATVGPSGSGKSQLSRFLCELVGQKYVTTIRGMGDFGDKFSLGDIHGKKLIMCLDLPDSELPASAVGMLKQLVGDDGIRTERKYKDPTTLYTKPLFFCAGNHPIRIPNIGKEQALLNRMVLIPFMGVCQEEDRIPLLFEKLLDEAPYIVREAIHAYSALIENGRKPTIAKIPTEYRPKDSRGGYNDVVTFFNTCCALDALSEVATADLYQAYKDTSLDFNWSSMSQIEFARLLSEAISIANAGITPEKRTNNTDRRGYRGLTLGLPQSNHIPENSRQNAEVQSYII